MGHPGHASAAAAAASLALGSNMMHLGTSGEHYGPTAQGLAASLAAGPAGDRQSRAAGRASRRKQAAGEVPQKQDAGAFAGSWQPDSIGRATPAIDFSSSSDFPTLGGTPGVEERVVMADVSVQESNGFWERPMRPVKVAAAVESAGATGNGSAGVNSTPEPAIRLPATLPRQRTNRGLEAEEQLAERRLQLEELLRQQNLHLEEPVVGFLLSLSTASDVLDYLLALYGDSEEVRRFAEAFGERRLGAPPKDDSKGPDSQRGPKEAADASTPKANRRRRGKGKEVDPSLLGFTAASSRIMQGSIDHGD